MDTGEVKNGKVVYKNSYMSDIAENPAAGDVAIVCDRIGSLLQYQVEQVTFTRIDAVEV
jgi:hypothetical protein